MNLLTILLFLYIITKPFYFWASGLPQISDFILILAFVIVFLTNEPSEIGKIIKKNIHFFLFLIFVVIINLIYSIFYLSGDFNLHTLYYIFDALGIITFTIYFEKNKKSFRYLKTAFALSLIVQLTILLLGLGKYYDGVRYMGTFNDPNQFAYYCLLAFSFIYLLGLKLNQRKYDFVYLLITLFLIFESSSTGMLAGASVFIIFYCIAAIRKILKNTRKYIPYILFGTVAIGLCIFSITLIPSMHEQVENIINSKTIARIENKITKAQGKSDISLWEERGYDRIVYYPHYLLYGAGEGNYARFEKAYHQREFHATLPGILFCYGLLPFILLLIWGGKKLKHHSIETTSIYIALILESFTLVNSRQVLFWVVFVLAGYICGLNRKIKK